MKKNIKLICFITFIFTYMANAQQVVTVTLADSNQTIHLTTKQLLEIKLPANPTTGYTWLLKENTTLATLVKLEGQNFISNQKENMVGAAGTLVIWFKPTGKGITNLQMIYKQPFDKDGEIANHYNLQVNCDGAYNGKRTFKKKNKKN